MVRSSGHARGILAALTKHGSRPMRLFGVTVLVLVLGSLFLTPVHSLWSKNLIIRGDVETRKVPDRCKDMHFDSYFWGTDKDDTIHGTSGNDMIWGLKGHDQIYGHGGSDCFDGGDDQDKCDDKDGYYDARSSDSRYDGKTGEHDSKRNSCDQWGNSFRTISWWHHSTPTIELAWEGEAGAQYYNVYRSTVSGGPYESLGSTGVPSYSDVGVSEDTWYYYVITAVDTEGFESVPSLETGQMVPSGAPEPSETSSPAPTDASAGSVATPTPTPVDSPPADTLPAPTDVPTDTPIDTPAPSSPTDTPAPAPTDSPAPAPTDSPAPAPTDSPAPP